jgi:hypothetical protein
MFSPSSALPNTSASAHLRPFEQLRTSVDDADEER